MSTTREGRDDPDVAVAWKVETEYDRSPIALHTDRDCHQIRDRAAERVKPDRCDEDFEWCGTCLKPDFKRHLTDLEKKLLEADSLDELREGSA